jgi:hypothetical protein
MFKRLNTGGELLSDQEVRNCTIRLLGNGFNDFIQELAGDAAFKAVTTPLSDVQKNTMFREELILRFFALKNEASLGFVMAQFLTSYLERVTERMNQQAKGEPIAGPPLFDAQAEKDLFEKTMKALASALGENTARRPLPPTVPSETTVSHLAEFHMRAFEVVAVAAARAFPNLPPPEQLAKAVTEFKQHQSFGALLFDPMPDHKFYSPSFSPLVFELQQRIQAAPH